MDRALLEGNLGCRRECHLQDPGNNPSARLNLGLGPGGSGARFTPRTAENAPGEAPRARPGKHNLPRTTPNRTDPSDRGRKGSDGTPGELSGSQTSSRSSSKSEPRPRGGKRSPRSPALPGGDESQGWLCPPQRTFLPLATLTQQEERLGVRGEHVPGGLRETQASPNRCCNPEQQLLPLHLLAELPGVNTSLILPASQLPTRWSWRRRRRGRERSTGGEEKRTLNVLLSLLSPHSGSKNALGSHSSHLSGDH